MDYVHDVIFILFIVTSGSLNKIQSSLFFNWSGNLIYHGCHINIYISPTFVEEYLI